MKAPFHPVLFLHLLLLLGGFVAAFGLNHVPSPQVSSWRNRPTLFTPVTSCKSWLRQNDRAILYPYGRNITANGAEALAQCLDSYEAAPHLHKFTDIFVVFPRAGPPEDTKTHLQKIVESLPGPLTVRWNHGWKTWPHEDRFEKWRLAHQAQKVQPRSNYEHWDIPGWKDWRGRTLPPPIFTECGAAALEISVDYGSGRHGPLVDIYHHLKTCNDVKSLSLSIQEGGCVIDVNAPFSFDFSRHDSFPSSIENLTVSNYDWDASSSGINHAQLWSEAMDWTSLKRLDIDRPPQSFVDAFTGRLPGLKSLTIRPKWSRWGTEGAFCSFDDSSTSMRQNYTSFITSMPPLEELHISGMGEHLDLTAILATHGHTLRNLTIHELEGDCAYATGNTTWTRPFLNADQLRTVKEMAPNLRGLAIDLDRNATNLAVEELAALSTFPNLRELTLHFDLEDRHRTYISRTCTVSDAWAREQYCKKFQLLEPLLGTKEAGAMLKAVGGPARPARTLEKLNVIVGNFNRKVGQFGLLVDFYYDPNEPYIVDCQFQGMRCSKTVWDDWEWQYERVEENSYDSGDWPMYAPVEYGPAREEI